MDLFPLYIYKENKLKYILFYSPIKPFSLFYALHPIFTQ